MTINTRDFGEIEVGKENLLTFPAGIFAFEDVKTFALISPLGEDVYPKWLQSTEDVTPCFVVFDPCIVMEDYSVNPKTFERSTLKTLKISPDSSDNISIRLLAIATVPNDFKKTTLNLKAPVVINTANNHAAQVILNEEQEFRFPLYREGFNEFEESEKLEESGEKSC
ncbi:MAG: flagellar assembly protein FliW [Oscillospiraceae bacterium]|nr:flagellar assembly protein FliW [Oscillospiraceae bacterium]